MYLFKSIVYDCKHGTLLAVRKSEGRITLLERLKLQYHLLHCKPCRDFIDQCKGIAQAGKNLESMLSSNPPFSLSAGARDRILNKISEEL